jgi:ureidoacrylate peracid hydrolase
MQPQRGVSVEARPQPLTIEPRATAIIVVDMQNDFGSEGGMFARAGIPIDGIRAVVEPTARVLAAARHAGMPVIYLKMEFSADLSDAGGWFPGRHFVDRRYYAIRVNHRMSAHRLPDALQPSAAANLRAASFGHPSLHFCDCITGRTGARRV